jgi:hypothetical protein
VVVGEEGGEWRREEGGEWRRKEGGEWRRKEGGEWRRKEGGEWRREEGLDLYMGRTCERAERFVGEARVRRVWCVCWEEVRRGGEEEGEEGGGEKGGEEGRRDLHTSRTRTTHCTRRGDEHMIRSAVESTCREQE